MPLSLTYHGETSVPVEIEGLTPDWARDKSLAEIERFEIFEGNRKIPLAEMFKVGGDPTDGEFQFEGNLVGVHWIGAHMRSGRIIIRGPAGRHVGSDMHGGEIDVEGDAGGWVGAEMHGGLIRVRGDAGHLVGAAYRGSAKGMTGGTILVDGSAGNEIGHSMRRGMIAIGGAAGDMAAFNMLAGTVLVLGECGIRPGAGMKRGTICLLGPAPSLLPTFRYACTTRLTVLSLMLHYVQEKGMAVDASLRQAEVEVHNGDMVALGKGEILLRPRVAS
jgi:formylmethanofuran dehydrogenase subunit C